MSNNPGGQRRTHIPARSVERPAAVRPVWVAVALGGLTAAVVLAVCGMPPVNLHGPLHFLGVMDPLCGGTRSVYLTLHGRWAAAVTYNPAGPALVLGAVAVLVRAARGSRMWAPKTITVPRRVRVALGVLAVVALEVHQQLHAGLLMSPWTGT